MHRGATSLVFVHSISVDALVESVALILFQGFGSDNRIPNNEAVARKHCVGTPR